MCPPGSGRTAGLGDKGTDASAALLAPATAPGPTPPRRLSLGASSGLGCTSLSVEPVCGASHFSAKLGSWQEGGMRTLASSFTVSCHPRGPAVP